MFVLALVVVARKWGLRWLDRDLWSAVIKSETLYAQMDMTIKVLQRQLRDRDDEIARMRANSAQRDERMQMLQGEIERLEVVVANLTRQLEEGQVIAKPEPPRILAIWPTAQGQPALDQSAESDALYNAGYAYTALRGMAANRTGVVLEIDRVRPTIIQVGGHGNEDGILLSDGIAEPGWWANLVRGRAIDAMVLLSCESSIQDEINISDALIRAGVKAVISCDRKITDAGAITFVELLYSKLADGLPLAVAVRWARLGLGRDDAEMIRLREVAS